jgi:hypothetical protein
VQTWKLSWPCYDCYITVITAPQCLTKLLFLKVALLLLMVLLLLLLLRP